LRPFGIHCNLTTVQTSVSRSQAQARRTTNMFSTTKKNTRCARCYEDPNYTCCDYACIKCGGCTLAHVLHMPGTCPEDKMYSPDPARWLGPITPQTRAFALRLEPGRLKEPCRQPKEPRYTAVPTTPQCGRTWDGTRSSTGTRYALRPQAHFVDGYGYMHDVHPHMCITQDTHIVGGPVTTGLWDPCSATCGTAGWEVDAHFNNPTRNTVGILPSITPTFAVQHMGGVRVSDIPGSRCTTNAAVCGHLLTGSGHVMDMNPDLGAYHGYGRDSFVDVPLIDSPENKAAADREWGSGGMM
jgi:hypothetical protein